MMEKLDDEKQELIDKLKQELIDKLNEMFQFESEDLDFGIYRIMNYKRNEIRKFIREDLINEIEKGLSLISEVERQEIEKKLEEKISSNKVIKNYLKALAEKNESKVNSYKEEFPEDIEEYERLQKKLKDNIKVSEDLRIYIYNRLLTFFSRYYDNGDFISKRRYAKDERYVIPYNGEEIYLYWVNKDQYYIKTTEYFRKYTFKTKEGLTVNFRVVEAEEEKGNNKSIEKKFFVLNEKVFGFDENKKELDIFFDYRCLTEKDEKQYETKDKNKKSKSENESEKEKNSKISQDNINEKIVKILEEKIPENSLARLIFEKEGEKTLIEKHLYKYTRRNTTNYFIHKDLKGFLERELDFYIKNEFLNLHDLEVLKESRYYDDLRLYLIGARVFREIALKIIEFLAQIENFQKKLWEKKKFVIDTHYVITLDKIKEYAGEEFLESIIDEILKNEKQLQEWKELFGIEVKGKKDLLDNNKQAELESEEWKKLPIDTKYFDNEFKWKLLAALSEKNDLDEILDGVLIKSENFQALNLLLKKYREKVQTIYIDPPYNTGNNDFLYKDNYQHSSWLTMMENRLRLAREMMKDNGVIFVSIANNANYYKESYKLGLLLESLFDKRFADLIWKRRSASGSYVISDITEIHEYIYVWGLKNSTIFTNILSPKKLKDYVNKDERGIFKWHDLVIHQYTREQRPNLFYGVVYNFKEDKLDFRKKPEEIDPSQETVIYPSEDGKSVFTMTKKSMEEVYTRGVIGVIKTKSGYRIMVKKYLHDEEGIIIGDPLKSIIDDNEIPYKIGGTAESTKELMDILGISFNTAKPSNLVKLLIHVSSRKDDIILDFFAGSGTTAHAVMKLNKEDGGKRKFILVEMGDYFNTVIIPRIKKIAYSFNWKNGRPEDMDGLGVFFKYHTLEQYEDALENIEFEKKDKKRKSLLLELPDYLVKYMLEWETKNSNTFLNLEKLIDPFSYKLKVIENYQQKRVIVDVVETFNYLIGLNVSKYKVLEKNGRKYVIVLGEKKGNRVAIVWRSLKNIDSNDEIIKEDKNTIEDAIKDFNPDEIYINGKAVVEGFKHIEPEFKRLMFEEVK